MDTEIFRNNFSVKGYEVITITTAPRNKWQYCKKLLGGETSLGGFPYQSFVPHNLLKNEKFNIHYVARSLAKKKNKDL